MHMNITLIWIYNCSNRCFFNDFAANARIAGTMNKIKRVRINFSMEKILSNENFLIKILLYAFLEIKIIIYVIVRLTAIFGFVVSKRVCWWRYSDRSFARIASTHLWPQKNGKKSKLCSTRYLYNFVSSQVSLLVWRNL